MRFGQGSSAVEINIPDLGTLFQAVREKFSRGDGFALATLNLDHLTKLPVDPAFASAYKAQDLIVADGQPIMWLSKLAKQPVSLMPGSDLVVPLCRLAAEMAMPVALMGSSDAALEGAKEALEDLVPDLKIVLTYAPPYGFDPSGEAAEQICEMLNRSGARLCSGCAETGAVCCFRTLARTCRWFCLDWRGPRLFVRASGAGAPVYA